MSISTSARVYRLICDSRLLTATCIPIFLSAIFHLVKRRTSGATASLSIEATSSPGSAWEREDPRSNWMLSMAIFVYLKGRNKPMPRFFRVMYCAIIPLLMSGYLAGQETASDKVTVPFSDPSRPGLVKAHLIHGAITVTAYDGKEVIVEARARSGRSRQSEKSGERTEGMKRLQISTTGLTVVEESNVVEVSTASHSRPIDLVIQVPVRTSLKLGCVNSGD